MCSNTTLFFSLHIFFPSDFETPGFRSYMQYVPDFNPLSLRRLSDYVIAYAYAHIYVWSVATIAPFCLQCKQSDG